MFIIYFQKYSYFYYIMKFCSVCLYFFSELMETANLKIASDINGGMLGDISGALRIDTVVEVVGSKRSAEEGLDVDVSKRVKSDDPVVSIKSPVKLQAPSVPSFVPAASAHHVDTPMVDVHAILTPPAPVASINAPIASVNVPVASTTSVAPTTVPANVPATASANIPLMVATHPHPVSVTIYGSFADPEDDELNRLQLKYAGSVIKSLKRSKESYLFSTPVDPVKLNIPQYFDVIKRPMGKSSAA